MNPAQNSLERLRKEQYKHYEAHKARVRQKYVHTHSGVKTKEAKVERGSKMKDFYNNLMK